jgi:hypothetical protein
MGHDWEKYGREECVRLTLFRSYNFVSFGWKEEKPKIWYQSSVRQSCSDILMHE